MPMPTLPLPFTTKSVEVATVADEEATAKSGINMAEFALAPEKSAQGVDVPMPMLPLGRIMRVDVAERTEPFAA